MNFEKFVHQIFPNSYLCSNISSQCHQSSSAAFSKWLPKQWCPLPLPTPCPKEGQNRGQLNYLKTFGFRLNPPPPLWTLPERKTLFFGCVPLPALSWGSGFSTATSCECRCRMFLVSSLVGRLCNPFPAGPGIYTQLKKKEKLVSSINSCSST